MTHRSSTQQRRPSVVVVGPATFPPGSTGGAIHTFQAFVQALRNRVESASITGVDTIEIVDTGSTDMKAAVRFTFHIRSAFRLLRSVVFTRRKPPVGLVWFMSSGSLRLFSPLTWLLARRTPVAVMTFGGWLGETVPDLSRPHRALVVASLNRATMVGAQSELAAQAARAIGVRGAIATGSLRLDPDITPRLGPDETTDSTNHHRRADIDGDGLRPLRLVYAGRISEDKGVARAIALVGSSEGRLTLDVFGSIVDDETFGPMVTDPPAGVAFHGLVGHDEVLQRVGDADFAILLSTYPGEGIPGFILEALSVGTPAILSDHLALPELIEDGVSGFIDHIGPDWTPQPLVSRLHAIAPADLATMRSRAFERSREHSEDRWMPLVLASLGLDDLDDLDDKTETENPR